MNSHSRETPCLATGEICDVGKDATFTKRSFKSEHWRLSEELANPGSWLKFSGKAVINAQHLLGFEMDAHLPTKRCMETSVSVQLAQRLIARRGREFNMGEFAYRLARKPETQARPHCAHSLKISEGAPLDFAGWRRIRRVQIKLVRSRQRLGADDRARPGVRTSRPGTCRNRTTLRSFDYDLCRQYRCKRGAGKESRVYGQMGAFPLYCSSYVRSSTLRNSPEMGGAQTRNSTSPRIAGRIMTNHADAEAQSPVHSPCPFALVIEGVDAAPAIIADMRRALIPLKRGSSVFVEYRDGRQCAVIAASRRELAVEPFQALCAVGILLPHHDGLFPGSSQTYRLATPGELYASIKGRNHPSIGAEDRRAAARAGAELAREANEINDAALITFYALLDTVERRDWAAPGGAFCFAAMHEIALKRGKSAFTIRRHLEILIDAGLVTNRCPGNGYRRRGIQDAATGQWLIPNRGLDLAAAIKRGGRS